MNSIEYQKLALLGVVSQMTSEQQKQMKEAQAALEAVMNQYGDVAAIALSLVGLEYASEH